MIYMYEQIMKSITLAQKYLLIKSCCEKSNISLSQSNTDMLFSPYPGPIYGVWDGWGLRGVDGGGEEEGGGREAEKS